jgi:N-acetylneuraminic acid mutarotase
MGWLKPIFKALGLTVLCLIVISALATKAYAAAPGTVGSWTTSGHSLPSTKAYSGSATYNGYVYMLGGFGGGPQNNVYYAHLNNDGSVGSWSSSVHTLPVGLSGASTVVNNGYIYVIGGYSNTYTDTVYYAPLNTDGSVGNWTTSGNTLPQGEMDMGSTVINNYVYVAGGSNGFNDIDNVYIAHLNNDGSVGSWITSGNLPLELRAPSAVTHNGYIYITGGLNTGSSTNTVLYAHINSNGSIGSWASSAHTLPQGVAYHAFEEYNGYIFAFGGYTGLTWDGVYSAPLNTNGSVGSWSTSSNSLPQALYGAGHVVHNGFVYIMGGAGGNILSTVYYASLHGYTEPVLSSKSTNVVSGSKVVVDVLTGTTGNPDSSTLRIVSGPSHGIAFDPPETITYIPTVGYVGQDSIVYEVCSLNDSSVCSQATLTFNVLAVVTAPSTGGGSYDNTNHILLKLISLTGTILIVSGLAIMRSQKTNF